jgi:hypothetical protein
MKAARKCKLQQINWALLPELENKLTRLGFEARNGLMQARVTLERFPDTLTFDSTEAAYQNIREAGIPRDYAVWLYRGKDKTDLSVYFGISGSGGIGIHVEGEGASVAVLDSVMEFLGLEPEPIKEAEPETPSLARTVFIAHRFDETAGSLADKLARFLELLGFSVVTGRSYAPKSIAEKVRQRLSDQAVIFVILTAGSDATWLTQESILAETTGKPLILLKATDAEFKPGLLSDHEYVPFQSPHIEAAFIAVLEGLREIGYLPNRRSVR